MLVVIVWYLVEPNYLQQFNLIIAANLIEINLVLLAAVCNAFNIPLVVVRSYGLIGYCRIQLSNHEIVESRCVCVCIILAFSIILSLSRS